MLNCMELYIKIDVHNYETIIKTYWPLIKFMLCYVNGFKSRYFNL